MPFVTATISLDRPQADAEQEAIRTSLRRGRPFGSDAWQQSAAAALRLQSTFRDPGRPRNPTPP